MRLWMRVAAAAALCLCAGLASAQAWPTKPVRLVVPFPPGGSVDPLARLLGTRLSESLGQQFIFFGRCDPAHERVLLGYRFGR